VVSPTAGGSQPGCSEYRFLPALQRGAEASDSPARPWSRRRPASTGITPTRWRKFNADTLKRLNGGPSTSSSI
jgi:hypothetical protein